MRYIGYLLLFALIAFGVWPYYTVFKLDSALSQEDTTELAALVDLPAIRANYKARIGAGADQLLPSGDANTAMAWIRQNLERLGDSALDQAITLPWVQETLRKAVTDATNQTPPYLLGGIDFAFFESYNRFLIRIGELGQGATNVRLTLEGFDWKITDIIR
ncbi:MAG: DUF2939 domain-containing protein [Lamprocystis purpurea]|jgi:hypothetical protein|uniref:DUF2939 domain-containing protein n=1 Tax=Lamprocystis purpurea TaxID=61598 RepID=UPI00037860E5|nr:DUF2939 domain-containing protein [Lamprocystis purpurea]MBV5272235.1 DUF2939 domain-containing protein [Lamprocystis purpurea]